MQAEWAKGADAGIFIVQDWQQLQRPLQRPLALLLGRAIQSQLAVPRLLISLPFTVNSSVSLPPRPPPPSTAAIFHRGRLKSNLSEMHTIPQHLIQSHPQ